MNSAGIIAESIANTSCITLDNIKASMYYSQNDYSSFELKIKPQNNSSSFFSDLCVINNNKDKNILLSVNKLKYGDVSPVSISAYADNSIIGFKINNNPQLCYTSKSADFKSTWNNSIYSLFFNVPSFLPDDLSYKEITKLLESGNILRILFALNFEELNIDFKELINNIDFSDRGKYPVNISDRNSECRLIKLRVSTDYIKKLFKRMEKSAYSSKMKVFAEKMSDAGRYINGISDDNIIVDFVLCDNLIYSVETSFHSENTLSNIAVNITDEFFNITAKKMSSSIGDSILFDLNINMDRQKGLNVRMENNKDEISTLSVERTDPKLITANVSYHDSVYNMYLSENISKADKIVNGKNIYNLSVSDLYLLYRIFK